MRPPSNNPNQLPQRPNPETYWVIPGRFLAGAYPGSRDPAIARQNLLSFLKTNLDTYIDLTAPGEAPDYQSDLLQEAADFALHVTHRRFIIGDFNLPTRATMHSILDTLDSSLASGHKIYLHCYGGIGRTGTVVGCYLVRQGLSGAQALTRLAQLYGTASQSRFYPRSPETDLQVQFVLDWHET